MDHVAADDDEVRLGRRRSDEQIELAKGVATTPTGLQHGPPPQDDLLGEGDQATRKKGAHGFCQPRGNYGPSLWIGQFGYSEVDFGERHIGYEQGLFGLGGDEGQNPGVGLWTSKF